MSFVLAAGSLSKLVLATDCNDAKLEDLTEIYSEKSDREIPEGLRWFYCVGLGVALLCMGLFHLSFCSTQFLGSFKQLETLTSQLMNPGIISLCHHHKESSGHLIRIPKRKRLTNRFAVCIILFCLPLVHSLNSLQLISTTTGLVIWVLLLELWGMSCPNESFFGEKKACRYTARCKISKKDLESAVKGGHVIKVQQLTDRGEKGMY